MSMFGENDRMDKANTDAGRLSDMSEGFKSDNDESPALELDHPESLNGETQELEDSSDNDYYSDLTDDSTVEIEADFDDSGLSDMDDAAADVTADASELSDMGDSFDTEAEVAGDAEALGDMADSFGEASIGDAGIGDSGGDCGL